MNARLVQSAGVASLLVLAACSSYLKIPVSQPIARTDAGPTQANAAPAALNTRVGILPAGAEQAPVCQAAQTCAALDAEQIPIACVKKIPYTNVLVPVGTTFEVVDPAADFMCLDTGTMVNGKEVLTCHGQELFSFQLRLSNPACSGAGLSVGTGQCDVGFGYDTDQKCCAPIGDGSVASTIVTVSLGACPLPNP